MAPMVLLFYFFYYALQPTLVPSPSVPTSPPAMQGLKDRQPYQSEGFPKKQPPPLTPALGPGMLLRGPAGRAKERAQRFSAAFPPEHPAVSDSRRQRMVSGVKRGAEAPNRPRMGWINKIALHQMTDVIRRVLPASWARKGHIASL